MELHPCPRRRRRLPAALRLGLLVLVAWLVAVALLPPVLGLRTAVVDEPHSGFGRGTLMVTRSVPASDVATDDVVALAGSARRVRSTGPGWLDVGDGDGVMTSDVPTLNRVLVTLPVAGLPLDGVGGLLRWLVAGGVAAFLAVLAGRRWCGGARGVR